MSGFEEITVLITYKEKPILYDPNKGLSEVK